ncbi:hypothetical protein M758_4G071900 [Ceratodon purpureus]|nr:hypothetical protein M758_4G071900 [Ceratodon purpureus]
MVQPIIKMSIGKPVYGNLERFTAPAFHQRKPLMELEDSDPLTFHTISSRMILLMSFVQFCTRTLHSQLCICRAIN